LKPANAAYGQASAARACIRLMRRPATWQEPHSDPLSAPIGLCDSLDQPTPEEIRVIRLAWEAAAA